MNFFTNCFTKMLDFERLEYYLFFSCMIQILITCSGPIGRQSYHILVVSSLVILVVHICSNNQNQAYIGLFQKLTVHPLQKSWESQNIWSIFALEIPKKIYMYYFLQWVQKSWKFLQFWFIFKNCLGNLQKMLGMTGKSQIFKHFTIQKFLIKFLPLGIPKFFYKNPDFFYREGMLPVHIWNRS